MESRLKIYTEIGIGNPSLISTEIEYPDGTETRQPGHIKDCRYHRPYIRIWIGKTVWVLTIWHINKKTKPYKTFKLIFGLEGF